LVEPKPVVFVVDDDAALCTELSDLFQSAGLASRCFGSARDFLDSPSVEAPACLVLDLSLPGKSGLELQREIVDRDLPLPIIFISGHSDTRTTVRAIKAGAVEFLAKPFRAQDLLEAVQQALGDARRARKARAADHDLRTRHQLLTPREHQVLAFVADGLLNKQIAHQLGISEITVKLHRGHLMQKMGAQSLAELIRMFERLNPRPRDTSP